MITDAYPITYNPVEKSFFFQSIGDNGIFDMTIIFQQKGTNRFNLALCAIIGKQRRDDFNTNNGDIVKIFSTVALALFVFLGEFPNAIIEFGASDGRRLRVYNAILKRRWHEIRPNFTVAGIVGEKIEPYDPGKFYDMFEICLKKR